MITRNKITREIADKIAEILIIQFKRVSTDFLMLEHVRDVRHFKFAATRAGYKEIAKTGDLMIPFAEVNSALERYWSLADVTFRPATIICDGKYHRLKQVYH